MTTALVWFRRDLRTSDHAALSRALQAHNRVFCTFIFDTTILDPLPQADRRVEFILRAVEEVNAGLRALSSAGSGLIVRHGNPLDEIPQLAVELGVDAVYVNRDYEPAALARDDEVRERLRRLTSADFHDFKDQVIFGRDEVLTQGGTPFSVFTPYKNAWLKRLTPEDLAEYDVATHASHLAPLPAGEKIPDLATLGFEPTNLASLALPTGMSGAQQLFDDFTGRMGRYADTRNFPAVKGPSYLSAHLRFGTISIRQLARHAQAHANVGAQTWLSELIWRDFYHAILWHHPHVVSRCFKPVFDRLDWDDQPALFAAWCQGRTGYPLVDAAMRQLAQTGYMHNRLRMVAASFLTKDLGLSWQQGEAWFAEQLIDFDLAANNGGWQWAASTGCDAQPWFRIFNPVTQSEKFDPQGKFIRRYVPELARVPDKFIHAPWTMKPVELAACGISLGVDYPKPVVDHAVARSRTLARFKAVTADGGATEET